MRPILAGLGIILAGGIFFGFTKPMYDSIQTDQAQITQYNAALAKATQLQALKQTLLSRYNSFNPTDLSRLQVMLPDQVNNIGLILDLDTLAQQFAMSLENVDISGAKGATNSTGGVGQVASGAVQNATSVGAPSASYDSLDVSFTVHGTYTQFIQFITSLETSLRIVDLVKLKVAGGSGVTTLASAASGSDNLIYTFQVTLRTYWLK
jgi:Tfp pilus assembly protein PilO